MGTGMCTRRWNTNMRTLTTTATTRIATHRCRRARTAMPIDISVYITHIRMCRTNTTRIGIESLSAPSYFLRNSLWQALHTSRVCSNATFRRARLPLAATLLRSEVRACSSTVSRLKCSSSSQISSLARVSPRSVPGANPSPGQATQFLDQSGVIGYQDGAQKGDHLQPFEAGG